MSAHVCTYVCMYMCVCIWLRAKLLYYQVTIGYSTNTWAIEWLAGVSDEPLFRASRTVTPCGYSAVLYAHKYYTHNDMHYAYYKCVRMDTYLERAPALVRIRFSHSFPGDRDCNSS